MEDSANLKSDRLAVLDFYAHVLVPDRHCMQISVVKFNFGSGEMAWKIWVNTNNNKLSYLNIPLPNIYLYRDGMHEASLAVLEKLYEIFGISDKFYVPEQIYFQNPKYKSDSHYYLPDSDTNEFCKLFKTACVFSKKLRLFN